MQRTGPFRRDGDAVAPVVAIVLAVAMTVLLAGVVFIVSTQFSKGAEKAPTVQFLTDSQSGQLKVVQADLGVDLSNLEVELSVAGKFAYATPAAAGTALAANTFTQLSPASGTTLTGGDAINFCATAGGSGITVTVRYVPANQVLYTNSFTTLAQCP